MPHETEILFNESGIQYQGVNDASGSTGAYPVQGLIVGQFKRGRLDKPMTIHRDNIKAMLGYDPKNPCYTAVQDVLDAGIPNVQVLRLDTVEKLICQIAPAYRYGSYILFPAMDDGTVSVGDGTVSVGDNASRQAWRKAVKESLTISVDGENITNFEILEYENLGVNFFYDGDLQTKKVVICAKVPFFIQVQFM